MWHDNETDRDFLNFTGVADSIAEIIIQAGGEPVSIGVSGEWGVGKSSMIRLVQSAVERRDSDPCRYVFVRFNAWLYQGYDDARAALMDEIATVLEAEAEERKTGGEKVKEFIKRIDVIRTARLLAGPVSAFALGLGPVGIAAEAFNLVRNLAGKEKDATALGEADKSLAELGATASGLLKPKPESSPPKEIQALRSSFEETLEALGVTLVVLIDDLDRCLPSTTIATLEAIRLFLFLKNAAFVIAADDEMIKHAVRKHLEVVDERLVTSYFDKLIQIPLRVPRLGTQEVRAYLFLLFVDDSAVAPADKEKIRAGLCEQLGRAWQGARVDRAFIETLGVPLPDGLPSKLEMAERLAPIMTSAKGINGNPRLIKRFLNTLSVRMSLARAHGIAIDEAVLVKMLLFERCGPPEAYEALRASVSQNPAGRPELLGDWEHRADTGEDTELPKPWDDDFVREWLRLPPRLAGHDLRGVLYVSREHAPILASESSLSEEGSRLLLLLMTTPELASTCVAQLGGLSSSDLSLITERLLERAREETVWGTPDILEACLALATADPKQGRKLGIFLRDRPPDQIKPAIVPRIGRFAWARVALDAWARNPSIASPVKKAIRDLAPNGNVA